LLQRRPRGGVGGRGALPRRLSPGRSHLRPQAADERPRRRRCLRLALGGGRRGRAPTPRDFPPNNHKPQMSAPAAADAVASRWAEGGYRFGIINFANPDMVGHTGVIPAAVQAVEEVDGCLGAVVAAVEASGGACIVTADHGNCDHMLEPDGSPNTAHSLNPVPVIVTVSDPAHPLELRGGGTLADVAPTLLQMLGIEQPGAM